MTSCVTIYTSELWVSFLIRPLMEPKTGYYSVEVPKPRDQFVVAAWACHDPLRHFFLRPGPVLLSLRAGSQTSLCLLAVDRSGAQQRRPELCGRKNGDSRASPTIGMPVSHNLGTAEPAIPYRVIRASINAVLGLLPKRLTFRLAIFSWACCTWSVSALLAT